MPVFHLASPRDVCKRLKRQIRRSKILFLSLTYNYHCDVHYVGDVAIGPVFWFIDNYVKNFGPIFVGFMLSMMGLVISAAYIVIVPYEWVRFPLWKLIIYFIIGHWLLVMCLFHYTMAWRTKPGLCPQGHLVTEAVSICKHCISPKPPRTHHCSICNRCILKMDHHCPWLSQCVGHYNHRYFFFTMFFLWLGCVFIVVGAFSCFVEHYWHAEDDTAPWCRAMNASLFYAPYACGLTSSRRQLTLHQKIQSDRFNWTDDSQTSNGVDSAGVVLLYGVGIYNSILFVYFTAGAVVIGVGGLVLWHANLISRGETSIEHHINKSSGEKFAKSGKVYENPYDFGFKENWRIFLGLDVDGRSFFWHVLLPSAHKPSGDGLSWRTTSVKRLETVEFVH